MNVPKREGWSKPQVILHWVTVALIIAQYFLSGFMNRAFEAQQRGETVDGGIQLGAGAHAVIGLTVLFIMLARFSLRFSYGIARTPPNEPRWASMLGAATHYAFYIVLGMMAVSGGLGYFAGQGWAANLHQALFKVLMVVIVLHVGGALVEQFVLRTGILTRMLKLGGSVSELNQR